MVTYRCTEMTDISKQQADLFKEQWEYGMSDKEFIEQVFEIAFGDDAVNRGFYRTEVLGRLRNFSDNALKWEEHTGNV